MTPEEGGRQGPVKSGYRCAHDMGVVANGQAILNDAEHVFRHDEWTALGHAWQSQMRFLAPEYQYARLYPGLGFTLQEGTKIVDCGTIIEIIDARMRRADGESN